MDTIYQGKSGTSYMVEETPLASGGEGSVYAIRGYKEFVLKVFKQDRRTKEREEKLLKMVEYHLNEEQLKQITWPQDVVYDQSGFVGYVMPRLWENRNLNVVYSTQNNQLDLRHRMFIAYNLCAAIDTVHSLNQVCGDLNPQNICVNLNLQAESALRVTLVDTDSYHITDGDKTYRCEVGLANYLAPEIQKKLANGQDLRTASLPTFTKETDLFALAVHIFSLIMNGCHPFACAKQTNNGYEHTMEAMNDNDYESVVLPQPIDNIKEGFFPFHQEKEGITYPLYAPDFKLLPKELQELFIRAFEMGYQNPKERPTTTEWLEVLKKYLSSTEFQQCERKHYYYNNNENKCPYCEANQRMTRLMHGQGYGTHDTRNDKTEKINNKKTTDSGNGNNIVKTQSGNGQTTNNQKNPKAKKDVKIAIVGIVSIVLVVCLFVFVVTVLVSGNMNTDSNQVSITTESSDYNFDDSMDDDYEDDSDEYDGYEEDYEDNSDEYDGYEEDYEDNSDEYDGYEEESEPLDLTYEEACEYMDEVYYGRTDDEFTRAYVSFDQTREKGCMYIYYSDGEQIKGYSIFGNVKIDGNSYTIVSDSDICTFQLTNVEDGKLLLQVEGFDDVSVYNETWYEGYTKEDLQNYMYDDVQGFNHLFDDLK